MTLHSWSQRWMFQRTSKNQCKYSGRCFFFSQLRAFVPWQDLIRLHREVVRSSTYLPGFMALGLLESSGFTHMFSSLGCPQGDCAGMQWAYWSSQRCGLSNFPNSHKLLFASNERKRWLLDSFNSHSFVIFMILLAVSSPKQVINYSQATNCWTIASVCPCQHQGELQGPGAAWPESTSVCHDYSLASRFLPPSKSRWS